MSELERAERVEAGDHKSREEGDKRDFHQDGEDGSCEDGGGNGGPGVGEDWAIAEG